MSKTLNYCVVHKVDGTEIVRYSFGDDLETAVYTARVLAYFAFCVGVHDYVVVEESNSDDVICTYQRTINKEDAE